MHALAGGAARAAGAAGARVAAAGVVARAVPSTWRSCSVIVRPSQLQQLQQQRSSRRVVAPHAHARAHAHRTLTTHVGAPLRKKVTTVEIAKMYKAKKPITMVTAYSYPSAVHVDAAGIDMLLVGDSLGMVELGHDTTLPVSMDDMLHHCKAVARGAERPLLVADMPFGSFEMSPQVAYTNAIRFLKEAGMDAVKMEGGVHIAPTVRALVDGGIAVIGHIGLTPQRISVLGGFRAQGKSASSAEQLLADALALQAAGCFALVIECVPAVVAQAITAMLDVPTIGIGAGPHTSGQVLVFHDLLGFFQHAHHAKVSPSFSKQYARVGEAIQRALDEYRVEVESRAFPSQQYSPYKMGEEEERKLLITVRDELRRRKRTDAIAAIEQQVSSDCGEASRKSSSPREPQQPQHEQHEPQQQDKQMQQQQQPRPPQQGDDDTIRVY